MLRAKENETYVCLASSNNGGPEALQGIFYRDTAYFDAYAWTISDGQRLASAANGAVIEEVYAVRAQDRSQRVGARRRLQVLENGLRDAWTLQNTTLTPQSVTMKLGLNPRCVDLFAVRQEGENSASVSATQSDANTLHFARTAADGVVNTATLTASPLPGNLTWHFDLAPGEERSFALEIALHATDADTARNTQAPPLPDLSDWRASFAPLLSATPRPGLARAVDDLRMLLLRTPFGAYPAAGMPIFVNFFGRDALITALMVQHWRPEVLRAVLLFLADHQGKAIDAFREEEPGKILHEIRRGELSRTNKIPFARYYGSVDSTPLFLVAAGAALEQSDDPVFRAHLAPAIDAALAWMLAALDNETGLARFEASGSGLTVQSWKDSANSMVDEHGRPARQPLAVAEVQGYCFAALAAMAQYFRDDRPALASELTARKTKLAAHFHDAFWLEHLETYAMALDGDGAPLRVRSSDPGHLLWSGIVPHAVAPRLVQSLMAPDMWSGWGLRTLGAREKAFNPVSYHNGSVWPHDTALFALGLQRYGFIAELKRVAHALLDLADASPDARIPELISGHDRTSFPTPIPYTHANAPQAWAAAGVIAMAACLQDNTVDAR